MTSNNFFLLGIENFNSLQIQSNLTIRLTTGTREEPHLFRQHKAVLAVQQWLVTDWTTGKTQQGCFLRRKMDKYKFIWARQAHSERNSDTIICLQKTMRKAHFFIHMMPLKINKLPKWQKHVGCSIIPPQNTRFLERPSARAGVPQALVQKTRPHTAGKSSSME